MIEPDDNSGGLFEVDDVEGGDQALPGLFQTEKVQGGDQALPAFFKTEKVKGGDQALPGMPPENTNQVQGQKITLQVPSQEGVNFDSQSTLQQQPSSNQAIERVLFDGKKQAQHKKLDISVSQNYQTVGMQKANELKEKQAKELARASRLEVKAAEEKEAKRKENAKKVGGFLKNVPKTVDKTKENQEKFNEDFKKRTDDFNEQKSQMQVRVNNKQYLQSESNFIQCLKKIRIECV